MGIVVIGAVFVDIKGYPLSTYIPGGRNAGRVEQVHGGVCRNVAEDIANVELRPTFVSLVDDTGSGQDVIDKLARHKVNTRYIQRMPDGMGTWLAVFNNDGDVCAAISKRPDTTPLTALLKEKGDEIFSDCDGIAIEFDLEKETVKQILHFAKKYRKKVYAAVSNMSIAMERRSLLQEIDCFVCNQQEAGLMFSDDYDHLTPDEMRATLAANVRSANIPCMVVTMGEQYRRLNWRIAENRKRCDIENAQDRQEAKQAVETVRDFLEEYDLIGDTESECLERMETDLHRRKLLCEELENAKNALDDFLKKNGDVGPAQQNALPEAEVLEQQERLTQARLDELEQKLQQARAQRRSLQASVECIPEWEDRLTALEDDFREAERKCDLTDRTMALLEKAKDALANSYMDKIEQGFRSYTQQLFPRQLGSVMVDKDLQPHIDVRGAAREVESFSAGLADSILLCMRLALVDALFGEETPFLILDDPFVNLDDEHTRRALAMLQKMAETHQILYLVCNTGRV